MRSAEPSAGFHAAMRGVVIFSNRVQFLWRQCVTPLLVCSVVLVAFGCKRVPTRALPTASVTAAKTPTTKPKKSIAETVRIEPIEQLCERTCKHWVSLRFQQPEGYGKIQDLVTDDTHDFLENQRKHNRQRCETLCINSADRDRAKCVLTASSPERANQCGNPRKTGTTNAIAEGHSSFKRKYPKRHGLHKRYIGSSMVPDPKPHPKSHRRNLRSPQTDRLATGYAPH